MGSVVTATHRITIDTAAFPAGLYLFKTTVGQTITTGRFAVIR